MDRPFANPRPPANDPPQRQPDLKARRMAGHGEERATILIVATESPAMGGLAGRLAQGPHRCRRLDAPREALAAIEAERVDLLVLDAAVPDADAAELSRQLLARSPHAKTIVISQRADQADIVRALRMGAVDFITLPADEQDVKTRCEAALDKARADRRRDERVVRLQGLCEKLHTARRDVVSQVDSLCRDLADAYQDLTLQMDEVAMASEFRTMLRQELDVEDLLRTALEYLLTKTGPTNAAVFLPDAGGQFTLGAYVNYDCPRESISVLLDHLGLMICPRMTGQKGILEFADARSFSRWIGFDAALLADAHVRVLACRHEDECLAVMMLFRARTEPFAGHLIPVLEVLRPILAQQIANVIRIHHRAGPQWPGEARGDDEYDLDDDGEYGLGGLAA